MTIRQRAVDMVSARTSERPAQTSGLGWQQIACRTIIELQRGRHQSWAMKSVSRMRPAKHDSTTATVRWWS